MGYLDDTTLAKLGAAKVAHPVDALDTAVVAGEDLAHLHLPKQTIEDDRPVAANRAKLRAGALADLRGRHKQVLDLVGVPMEDPEEGSRMQDAERRKHDA